MRREPAEKRTARLRIVDTQKHVRAEIRRRPRSENSCLDLVQLERRHLHRTILTGGFRCGQHGRILYLGSGSIRARTHCWLSLSNLVEEFVQGLAHLFQPPSLRDCKVRIGDVPRVSRELELD